MISREDAVRATSARHDRQNQARRSLRVVKDGLLRAPKLGALAERRARIGIAIEPRKVAAGDLERECDGPAANRLLVAPTSIVISSACPGVSRRRRVLLPAVARAKDAVGQRARRAVGKDVHELRREVGVGRGRRRPQPHLDRPGHFNRRRQRSGRVDQDVRTPLQLALIGRASANTRRAGRWAPGSPDRSTNRSAVSSAPARRRSGCRRRRECSPCRRCADRTTSAPRAPAATPARHARRWRP